MIKISFFFVFFNLAAFGQKLSISPFDVKTNTPQSSSQSASQPLGVQNFRLSSKDEVSSDITLQKKALFRSYGLAEGWQVVEDQENKGRFLFQAFSIPVCLAYGKIHVFSDGTFYAMGNIPDISPPVRKASQESFSLPLELVVQKIGVPIQNIRSQTLCWQEDKRLKDSWNLAKELKIQGHDGKEFHVITSSDQVYFMEEQFIHVDATLRAFDSNPKDDALVDETVSLSKDGSTLDNTFFTTRPDPIARIQGVDHRFDVLPTDSHFPEVSVFFHATRMLEWFIHQGYTWTKPPLTLIVNQPVFGSLNNAVYIPQSTDVPGAKIIVASGDGSLLLNLNKDGSVVSHEMGHHILFDYLKSTSQNEAQDGSLPASQVNHSLAIHEGYADSFTFARTGNPCLGPSICPRLEPDQGTVCYVPETCLRTAENDVVYKSSQYWGFGRYAHLKGQLVSGLMWDLRKKTQIPEQVMDQLLYRSASFLPEKAVYLDVVKALASADKELFSGKFYCEILSAAKTRGFTEELKTLDQTSCGGPPATITTTTVDSQGSKTQNSSGKHSGCGSVWNVNTKKDTGPDALILFLLWPVFLMIFPYKQKR